jgi:hypothetical protein
MPDTSIATALDALIFQRSSPVEQVVSTYFSDDYVQRTDGVESDRPAFVAHIEHLRTLLQSGTIVVHEELQDGTVYADRHTVRARKFDGSSVASEVYLFAELAADGRFARVHETTLLISGAEEDRGLGTAH